MLIAGPSRAPVSGHAFRARELGRMCVSSPAQQHGCELLAMHQFLNYGHGHERHWVRISSPAQQHGRKLPVLILLCSATRCELHVQTSSGVASFWLRHPRVHACEWEIPLSSNLWTEMPAVSSLGQQRSTGELRDTYTWSWGALALHRHWQSLSWCCCVSAQVVTSSNVNDMFETRAIRR